MVESRGHIKYMNFKKAAESINQQSARPLHDGKNYRTHYDMLCTL